MVQLPYPRMRFFRVPALSLLLCLAVLLAGGCAVRGTKGSGEEDRIRYALPGGKPANEEDILRMAGNADYILIGEQHDNFTDHKAQAELVDLLARKDKAQVLLGLEMLPRGYYDFQLNAFRKGKIGLAQLPEALNWKHTWGYDFALYRPIFDTVRTHGIQTYGLNLPDAVRRSVSRKGLAGLSPIEKGELPKKIIPPRPEQVERLLAVFRMHGVMRGANPGGAAGVSPATATPKAAGGGKNAGVVPAVERGGAKKTPAVVGHSAGQSGREGMSSQKMLDRFLLIQSLWDSTMAEQAVAHLRFARRPRAKAPRPLSRMVILAGAGHVEYGYGIASRIAVLEPDARIMLIMPYSGAVPDPGAANLYYYSEPRSHSSLGFSFTSRNGRVLIINVAPGSAAEAAGMRTGDTVLRAGDQSVKSPMDLHKAAVTAKRQGQPLRFRLERNGKPVEARIPASGKGA